MSVRTDSTECTTEAMLARIDVWEREGRLPGAVDRDARLGVSPDGRLIRWSYCNPFIHN